MDMVSEVIGSIRVGRTAARFVTVDGFWGMRYSAFEGSGFHIMLQGGGWLISPTDPPRALHPGDVVVVPSGAEHGLSHTPARLQQLPPAVMEPDPPSTEQPDTLFLCGAYRL